MTSSLLASLASAGVLERSGSRHQTLRVSPRFLAHAEGTSGRLRLQGRHTSTVQSLEAALQTWDEFANDPYHGARYLQQFLQDHDQLGQLAPTFPSLTQFVHPNLAAA